MADTYRIEDGPAIACCLHPKALAVARWDRGASLCRECCDKVPGPRLTAIDVTEEIAAQDELDQLHLLLGDASLDEVVLVWEVDGDQLGDGPRG